MPILAFDIETNSLYRGVSTIHCISIGDYDTVKIDTYTGPDIAVGIVRLLDADKIVGHNVLAYDIPVIEKLTGVTFDRDKVHDTLVMSRLLFPERSKKEGGPGHSLKEWGITFGLHKGDHSDWSRLSPEMIEYCERDVEVTMCVLAECLSRAVNFPEAVQLEHETADCIALMTRTGFRLDVEAATDLANTLSTECAEIALALGIAYPPTVTRLPLRVSRGTTKKGETRGVLFMPVRFKVFKPTSRDHIAERLIDKYGWQPGELTEGGKPKVSGKILQELPWPEAQDCAQLLDKQKMVSMIRGKSGNRGWLAFVQPDGRVYGEVNPLGTVTGRMTHSDPNIGQVDTDPRMRRCWIADPGHVLIGIDAEALELNILAHYLEPFDKGKFLHALASGHDVHESNRLLLGMHNRKMAKAVAFAYIYGAGFTKLGHMLMIDALGAHQTLPGEAKDIGKEAVKKLGRGIHGLVALNDQTKAFAATHGYVIGIDGRHLLVRREYAALNTKIQSAGAILMKRTLVNFCRVFKAYPTIRFIAHVHDEFIFEAPPEEATYVGAVVQQALADAKLAYCFKGALTGTAHVGSNWSETK